MPRLSATDAVLRLWMLAEIAMAGLNGWIVWGFRSWPADLPGPQPLRAVQISELFYLFIFVPAGAIVIMRWLRSRDRPLAVLALAYGALSLWSFMAWDAALEDGAALAGELRQLYVADALIALGGLPVALRALRLR